MKWTRTALLPLILVLGSCGADGGSRGTGATTIEGNVATVDLAAALQSPPRRPPRFIARLYDLLRIETTASARTDVEGIRVTVEGKGGEGRTDANGFFSVQGSFEGSVSVLFDRADQALAARIMVDVPGGGTLRLNNVHLNSPPGTASAESQEVAFEGRVVGTNCAGKTISLVSRQSFGDGDTYTVRLDGSSLHDASGQSVACADLEQSELVRARGSVNGDGTFGEADIQVER